MDLMELAERVEAASGADRDLDALIHFATNNKWVGRIPTWPPDKIRHNTGGASMIEGSGYMYGDWVPLYTTSIDDALTLVPETADYAGERFRLEHWNTNGVYAPHVRATAWVAGAPRVYAATPALALTAAALRAIARAQAPAPGEGGEG